MVFSISTGTSSAAKTKWKLGDYDYDYDYDVAAAGRKRVKTEFNLDAPANYHSASKDSVHEGDWLLQVPYDYKNGKVIGRVEWMRVDFVVPIGRHERAWDKDYPFQAIQIKRTSRYGRPPFSRRRLRWLSRSGVGAKHWSLRGKGFRTRGGAFRSCSVPSDRTRVLACSWPSFPAVSRIGPRLAISTATCVASFPEMRDLSFNLVHLASQEPSRPVTASQSRADSRLLQPCSARA